MNETVRLLQAHHSCRSYRIDPVPPEILDAIVESPLTASKYRS
jgi:hypothetical protein